MVKPLIFYQLFSDRKKNQILRESPPSIPAGRRDMGRFCGRGRMSGDMGRAAKETTKKRLKERKPGARKSAVLSPESGTKVAAWGKVGGVFRARLADPAAKPLPDAVRAEPNTAGEPAEEEGIRELLASLFARGSGAGIEAEIARHEIAGIVNGALDEIEGWACQSPGEHRGRWAGGFLAELVNRLVSESPGLKVEWKEDRVTQATALASSPAFVDRLRRLRTRGPGKKLLKARGAEASRFVFQVWHEVLDERASLLLKAELSRADSFLCPPPVDERRIVKVLGAAENALRAGRSDRADIARKVFSDLLAGVLESRWEEACRVSPDLAASAERGANRRGMMSSFAAKRDNLREAWLSIAQGEAGLSRLLP